MDRKTIWAPVAYRASFRHKGDRTDRVGAFYRRAPLQVGVVEPDAAPVVFAVGRPELDLRWRLVDGTLMREMHDPETGASLSVDSLADEPSLFLKSRLAADPHRRAWSDYPFLTTRHRDDAHHLPADPDFAVTDRAFGRWVRDDWAASLARANAAAADLVVCGDTLLRRAAPPVLAVRIAQDGESSFVRVTPSVMEIEGGEDTTLLPHDAVDEAVELAERLVSTMKAFAARHQLGTPGPLRMDLEGLVESAGAPPAVRADDPGLAWLALQWLSTSLGHEFSGKDPRTVEPRLLKAFAAIREAVESPSDDALVEEAIEWSAAIARGLADEAPWIRQFEGDPGYHLSVSLAMVNFREDAIRAVAERRTDEIALGAFS